MQIAGVPATAIMQHYGRARWRDQGYTQIPHKAVRDINTYLDRADGKILVADDLVPDASDIIVGDAFVR